MGRNRKEIRTPGAGYLARWLLLGLLLAALALPAAARRKKHGSKTHGSVAACTVWVRVLRKEDGKPIRNAGVVLRSLHADGGADKDAYELKTNGEGKAFMTDLPCGGLRVQVIAHRMRTFGRDFQISPPGVEIVVRMTPPVGQLSAY